MAGPPRSPGQKSPDRPSSPPQTAPNRGVSPAASPSLASTRAALARGDIRTARRLAKDVVATGSEPDRAAAQRLLADLAPDPAALLAAAAVLLVIVLAAWLALFRAH